MYRRMPTTLSIKPQVRKSRSTIRFIPGTDSNSTCCASHAMGMEASRLSIRPVRP
jgi:hypothetical protein